MPVTRDDEKNAIEYTDLGVTLRTLMGVAAEGYKKTGRRVWMLLYNGVNVGKLQVRSDFMGKKDATANSNGTGANRSGKKTPAIRSTGRRADSGRTAGRVTTVQQQAEGKPDGEALDLREGAPAIEGEADQRVLQS